MYLYSGWKEKENCARKRINSDNAEARAPRICRSRLASENGRPAFNDVSNNYRLQNNANQDYRITGERTTSSEVESIPDETLAMSRINPYNVTNAATQFLRKITPTAKISTTQTTVSFSLRRMYLEPNEITGSNIPISMRPSSGKSRDVSPYNRVQVMGAMSLDSNYRTAGIATGTHSNFRNIVKPQKKMTLVKKSTRISKYNENAPYCLNIYTPEYINDIILNSLMMEYKFKLKRNFHLEHNPCLKNRFRILNWLITIQDDLHITNEMYYSIVHLFDVALSKVYIANDWYQLTIITIAWLVTKYSGTKMISAPKLTRLCDNAYSQRQLLEMELKMLSIFQFKFHAPEPILFANYYLYKLNIQSDHQIVHTTNYIMESFTLSPQYSTYEPSKIAAAALFLCIEYLYPGQGIYHRIQYVAGYASPTKLVDLVKIMQQHLKAISTKCYFKAIFSKYATRDTKFASITFSKYLS